jgi:hypothetical protein
MLAGVFGLLEPMDRLAQIGFVVCPTTAHDNDHFLKSISNACEI